MSCDCDITTPQLVLQPQLCLSVKKINVTVKSSTGMVLRPLAVLTALVTAVSRLRLSMSVIQKGIFWVKAARFLPRISPSDMASRSWFSQALAAIMQLGIYVTSAQRLLKASFSLIGETPAELCPTMEGWALSESLVSWERLSEHMRSLTPSYSICFQCSTSTCIRLESFLSQFLWLFCQPLQLSNRLKTFSFWFP